MAYFATMLLIVALVMSGGCSEDTDSSGDSVAQVPHNDGIIVDGSGVHIVTGTIEDFGSIIINGKRYSTEAARFAIKGDTQGGQEDLAKGDYVQLYFQPTSTGENKASLVVHEPPLSGEVTFISTSDKQLMVMNQTVLLTGATRTGDAGDVVDINDFRVGDFVEISGPLAGEKRIVASRISDNPLRETFVTGSVTAVTGSEITIAGTRIDVSRLQTGTLVTGAQLSLSGRYDETRDLLVAESYREIAKAPTLAPDAIITFEGFISAVNGERVTIGDTELLIDANTQIIGGVRSDIANQARVVVSYRAAASPPQAALTLEIKSRAPGQIRGIIQSKSPVVRDAQGRETGVIAINGESIEILGSTAVTLFQDNQLALNEQAGYPYSHFLVGDDALVVVAYDENNRAVAKRIYLYRTSTP
jgi:hypothetical protein